MFQQVIENILLFIINYIQGKEKISKNIKEARIFAGYAQKQIAENMFITQQQYSRFENAKFELNYEQILKICELCNVEPNDIFDMK